MSDEETTGTPEQDDGDAAEQTTGTPETDDRDATSETKAQTDAERLNLEWKIGLEETRKRAKEMEAELAEARARLTELSPAKKDVGSDLRKGVEHFRNQEDPVAAYMLYMEEEMKRRDEEYKRRLDEIESGTRTAFQATEIQDKTLRQEALSQYTENPGKFGDFDAALKYVEHGRQTKEIDQLKAALEKAQKSSVNDNETVATEARSVSASEVRARKKKTYAQFDKEQAHIRQTQGDHAAMLFAGKIGVDFDLE